MCACLKKQFPYGGWLHLSLRAKSGAGPMFEEPESGSRDISLGLCFDLSRRNGIMSSDGT